MDRLLPSWRPVTGWNADALPVRSANLAPLAPIAQTAAQGQLQLNKCRVGVRQAQEFLHRSNGPSGGFEFVFFELLHWFFLVAADHCMSHMTYSQRAG